MLTGQLVRLAVRRHLRDLKTGHTRGLWFDVEAGQHALDFFQFLRHSKGEWAGQEVRLEPWQQFIVWAVFGWKRADGARRYRTVYVEVARKNGKSTFAAGIGLYLFFADGEPGAEVYSAATKRDQARIVHGESIRMVKASPALTKRITVFRDNLHVARTASKYEPVGQDSETLDGLNVHAAIVDELHAHKTRGLYDILQTAMGARRAPMMFSITTAGTNQTETSICWELHAYAEKILKGTVHDDSVFAYIAALDEGDDWEDERLWIKANPNLGVSVKLDYLQDQAAKAKQIPAALNRFLNKLLNKWTQQVSRWIPLTLWDRGNHPVDERALAGRTCYGGLDLSSVSDLTAWVLVFPEPDDLERLQVLVRLWVPESRLADRQHRYQAQYQAWAREGFLQVTPGDAVDYEFIKAQILRDAQTFRLIDLNIDRLFQGYQLAMQLAEEGLTVAAMGMGFLSMAAPTKELERLLLKHKIQHGGHPVLRWMMDNTAVKEDPAGNLKPDKANSQGKIDGIVALIMAIDRAMRREGEHRSVYEGRGIISL